MDTRVADVLDSAAAIALVTSEMAAKVTTKTVGDVASGAWVHGLVVGLRLAEEDPESAIDLLRVLRESNVGDAVQLADDAAFTENLKMQRAT